jgi:hypothetical protein
MTHLAARGPQPPGVALGAEPAAAAGSVVGAIVFPKGCSLEINRMMTQFKNRIEPNKSI